MEYTELIGYIAMMCVGIFLSFKKIKNLRAWNLAGAILFAIYGVFIGSIPVVILNVFLSVVNTYHLLSANTQSKN